MAKKTVSLTDAALPVLGAIIEKKTTIPILNFARVVLENDASIAYATDLDVWASVRVNDGTEPGMYRIVGKELVHSPSTEVANFPMLPTEPKNFENGITFPINVSALKSTLPFISKEESRYTLNGLLLALKTDRVRYVATDGHRLRLEDTWVETTLSGETPKRYLLPRKFAAAAVKLAKSENVQFTVNASKDERSTQHFRIDAPGFTLWTRQLSGQFPNYEAVLPRKFPHHVSVSKSALLTAIATVRPFSDARSHAGDFHFQDDGQLRVFASNTSEDLSRDVYVPYTRLESVQFSMDSLDRQLSGGHGLSILMPMRIDGRGIGMNLDYVKDNVETCSVDDVVHIGFTDAKSSVTFSGDPLTLGQPWGTKYEPETEAETVAA